MARLQQKVTQDFSNRIYKNVHKMLSSITEDTDKETKGRIIEEAMALLEEGNKRLAALTAKGCGKAWDFTKEKARTVFAEDEHIILRYCQPEEKDMYIQIKRENSDSPDFYEKEEMVKSSWGIFQTEHSLVCSIIRKSDKRFIGYISIKDTRVNLWEIAIELLQEHCHKGYGTKAIPLLVKEIWRKG